MKIELLHHTPLWVASKAIRKCWASEDKSDSINIGSTKTLTVMPQGYVVHADMGLVGDRDKELIHRVGNKNKHSSTLEHLNYTFDIDGISRACLQELARHRHASISVKSTRYTLKELKKVEREQLNPDDYLVSTGNKEVDRYTWTSLRHLKSCLEQNISNDLSKYSLPEAYKTSLVWTINARSLQNFLSLRTDRSALWEIQDLAREIYKQLPEEHKYLFEEFVKEQQ